MCISMIVCHPGPTFLGKCHLSRNMVVLTALAGYSKIKLESGVGGNCSLQCFWVSSNSREQDGASLPHYSPQDVWIPQWCQERPQPCGLHAAAEGPAGTPGKAKPLFPGEQRRGEHAPCRNRPYKNPFLAPNLFSFLLPGLRPFPRAGGAVTAALGTGTQVRGDTGMWGHRCSWGHGCSWRHGCTGTPTPVGTRVRGDTDAPGDTGAWGHGCSWHGLNPAEPGIGADDSHGRAGANPPRPPPHGELRRATERSPPIATAGSRRHTNHPGSPRCFPGNSRYRG